MSKINQKIKKYEKILKKLKKKKRGKKIDRYLKKIFDLKKGKKISFELKNRNPNNLDWINAFFEMKRTKNGFEIKATIDDAGCTPIFWDTYDVGYSKKEVKTIIDEWVNAEQ